MEVTVTRGKRRKQLLDGLKERRREWNWRGSSRSVFLNLCETAAR